MISGFPSTKVLGLNRPWLITDSNGVNRTSQLGNEEILAKHGYIFFNDEARNTFILEQWYVPINFKVDHLLTELEKANLDKIYTKF